MNDIYKTGQKRVLAVHDICGVGKCSLTVALPVLSAAGIEACAMPTAVFSTHTAFSSFNFHDLTDYLLPMAKEIKNHNVHFDAIYTGYLANGAQAAIIKEITEMLGEEDTLLIVDPAMADHGRLYSCLPDDFPKDMKTLCCCASVVTPNVTEAMLLLEKDTSQMPKNEAECAALAEELGEDLKTNVVLTSVPFENGRFGCVVWEKEKKETFFVSTKEVPHSYHGTGDTFSSVLTAALLNGKTLVSATKIAAEFVQRVIEKTAAEHPNLWYGVNFENELATLIKTIEEA